MISVVEKIARWLPLFKPDFYIFSYNEQLSNIYRNFMDKFLLYHTSLIDGEKLLSVVVGVVSFSADKPLDFHDTIFQYSLVFLKYHKAFEILSKVVLHYWKSSFVWEKDLNHMFVIFLVYLVVFLIHFPLVNVLIYLRYLFHLNFLIYHWNLSFLRNHQYHI